jgi:hypothetical protein
MPGRLMQSTIAAALAASTLSVAPVARADPVGFSVAIGGPGYAVAFGNAPYWGAPASHAHGYRRDDDRPRYVRPRWAPVYAAPPAGYVVSGYGSPPVYAPPVGYVVSTYPALAVYAPRLVYAGPVLHRGRYAEHPHADRHREYRFDRD